MWKEILTEKSFWILLFMVICAFFLSIFLGNTTFSFNEILHLNNPQNHIIKQIVWHHRLPRTITAILTGIALPMSGWILQEFFRNPLAGPSVLGITSAAGLGVASVIVLGTALGLGAMMLESWVLILGALIGSFMAMLILIFMAQQISSTTALIIVGFMIAALSGALIGVLEFFASQKELKSYILWTFGSLNGLNQEKLLYFILFILVGLFFIVRNIPNLIKMQLGEQYAKTMGVNVKGLRFELIIASSVLTGVTTALVGPIAFIGLAVPHICRMYLKTGDFRKLFTYILLAGIFLMLVFGLISELFPGGALPINIITALFGAPVVLSIILGKRQENYD